MNELRLHAHPFASRLDATLLAPPTNGPGFAICATEATTRRGETWTADSAEARIAARRVR
jgi:hypothetical protein